MATAPTLAPSVTGLLITAALERYQLSWDQLVERWFDHGLCVAINADLMEIRKLIAALPQLSVEMAEMVMRHAQLLRALVRPVAPSERCAQVAALKRKHSEAVAAIRRRCAELFSLRG